MKSAYRIIEGQGQRAKLPLEIHHEKQPMKKSRARKPTMRKSGQIRIIGGMWKSRLLRFSEVADLRPSPDAVRETLFNWLPHNLNGKSCLDLFAGSGSFGFEAASRGASKVVMVESNSTAVSKLRSNREILQAENVVEIIPLTVDKFLHKPKHSFDIVFLDPPFSSQVIESTCRNLADKDQVPENQGSNGFLCPDALVYIESLWNDYPLPIPPSWHIIRQKRCGMVKSTLIQT